MKLNRLWLWYFPLLFLPNLGYGIKTANGSLQLSDFLIGPYLVLLLFALPHGKKLNIGRVTPYLGLFVVWALISTITMPARYHYVGDGPLTFSLLKIAKLCLYGLAGIWTARALADEESRRTFDWSLLTAGIVTGVSLMVLGSTKSGSAAAAEGLTYSATNGTSAMMAILVAYLAGRYITGHDSPRWRFIAKVGFLIMAAGLFLSFGRGGWVAAMASAGYLLARLGFRRQVVTFGLFAVIFVVFFYNTQSGFRGQVDKTIFAPSPTATYKGTRNVGTIDDGDRFQTWAHEAPKLLSDPIIGRGFFHRGGNSGLWSTGSHNFWLQMFLETGIVGGLLVTLAIVSTWKQATSIGLSVPWADLSYKAALVAAVVGGLSGEYFYGGMILFALFAVYAPIGGLAHQNTVEAAMTAVPTHTALAASSPGGTRAAPPRSPEVAWGLKSTWR